jgi:hypothetical protein
MRSTQTTCVRGCCYECYERVDGTTNCWRCKERTRGVQPAKCTLRSDKQTKAKFTRPHSLTLNDVVTRLYGLLFVHGLSRACHVGS